MKWTTSQRIHHVTALISFAAIVFYLFFQINKGGPFRDINPFAEDPYDAIGSFAIQGALLIGFLTYARALRFWEDPAQAIKLRLNLRRPQAGDDPLPDQVEMAEVNFLQGNPSCRLDEVERELYTRFPGLLTPSLNWIFNSCETNIEKPSCHENKKRL